jgi:hypothetical protein
METTVLDAASVSEQADSASSVLPPNFGSRLIFSVPLMIIAAICLFGFIGTFEPMPRIAQLSWRAIHASAGVGSVIAICWLWLRPRARGRGRGTS